MLKVSLTAAMLGLAAAGHVLAHSSPVPHEHPHGVSMLLGADVLALAALGLGLGALALRPVRRAVRNALFRRPE